MKNRIDWEKVWEKANEHLRSDCYCVPGCKYERKTIKKEIERQMGIKKRPNIVYI